MKQPKIKIFGGIHNVVEIGFDKKTGIIDKIVYEFNEYRNNTVFRGDTIHAKSLTSEVPITEPTRHPYHGYSKAPDLASLLVTNDEEVVVKESCPEKRAENMRENLTKLGNMEYSDYPVDTKAILGR